MSDPAPERRALLIEDDPHLTHDCDPVSAWSWVETSASSGGPDSRSSAAVREATVPCKRSFRESGDGGRSPENVTETSGATDGPSASTR